MPRHRRRPDDLARSVRLARSLRLARRLYEAMPPDKHERDNLIAWAGLKVVMGRPRKKPGCA